MKSGNYSRIVNVIHITASAFINDNESGLHHDYEAWLEAGPACTDEPVPAQPHRGGQRRRAPQAPGDTCTCAACKRGASVGREVVVAVTDGKLDFGPWEAIFYGEFDGRRRKRALVKIIGE